MAKSTNDATIEEADSTLTSTRTSITISCDDIGGPLPPATSVTIGSLVPPTAMVLKPKRTTFQKHKRKIACTACTIAALLCAVVVLTTLTIRRKPMPKLPQPISLDLELRLERFTDYLISGKGKAAKAANTTHTSGELEIDADADGKDVSEDSMLEGRDKELTILDGQPAAEESEEKIDITNMTAIEVIQRVTDMLTTAELIEKGLVLSGDDIDDLAGLPRQSNMSSGDVIGIADVMNGTHPIRSLAVNAYYAEAKGNAQMFDDNIVHYCFDSTLDAIRRRNFERAIRRRAAPELFGCLSFVKVQCSDPRLDIKVENKRPHQCTCTISNPNVILINMGSCFGIVEGFVIHELGHALGMMHEHQRTDRDSYVTIHWANIDQTKTGWHVNWHKNCLNSQTGEALCDTNPKGRSYDYNSIMHYGTGSKQECECISPWLAWLVPWDERPLCGSGEEYHCKEIGPKITTATGATIGRRNGGFSPNDVEQIRETFQCWRTGLDRRPWWG